MVSRSTDAEYLRYQYGDAEKLRVRAETHRLYSERPDDMRDWLLGRMAAEPGHLLLDVGCGTGWLHPALAAREVRVLGFDLVPRHDRRDMAPGRAARAGRRRAVSRRRRRPGGTSSGGPSRSGSG
jgi:SAM-dependent methyltransferase